jgi:hypothetical protein
MRSKIISNYLATLHDEAHAFKLRYIGEWGITVFG